MPRFEARYEGITPLTIPTNAATAIATAAVAMVMCIETGKPMPGRAMNRMATLARATPSSPPISAMAMDSLNSSFRMLSRVKPRVRRTATSRVRSRIDMAMVLAQTRSVVKTTAPQMARMKLFTLPSVAMKSSLKACSLSLLVGVEEESAGGWINGVKAAQREVEVGGKNRTLEMDVVANLPVEPVGKYDIGDTAGAVFFPGGELVGGHDLVGGDFEIFVGIGGELGEVVRGFVVNVGAPEPSHGSDVDDAGNGANLVAIIDGKKIGERDLMTSDDAQGGIGCSLVDVEA